MRWILEVEAETEPTVCDTEQERASQSAASASSMTSLRAARALAMVQAASTEAARPSAVFNRLPPSVAHAALVEVGFRCDSSGRRVALDFGPLSLEQVMLSDFNFYHYPFSGFALEFANPCSEHVIATSMHFHFCCFPCAQACELVEVGRHLMRHCYQSRAHFTALERQMYREASEARSRNHVLVGCFTTLYMVPMRALEREDAGWPAAFGAVLAQVRGWVLLACLGASATVHLQGDRVFPLESGDGVPLLAEALSTARLRGGNGGYVLLYVARKDVYEAKGVEPSASGARVRRFHKQLEAAGRTSRRQALAARVQRWRRTHIIFKLCQHAAKSSSSQIKTKNSNVIVSDCNN